MNIKLKQCKLKLRENVSYFRDDKARFINCCEIKVRLVTARGGHFMKNVFSYD